MAQVTYRGVQYDSKEYNAKVLAEAEQARNHDLMYRGLKVVRTVAGGKQHVNCHRNTRCKRDFLDDHLR